MENQPTTDPKVITTYNLKQMIASIIVGAAISILTVLFQYAVEWLRGLPAELPGAIVGMLRYWVKWQYIHHA